MFSAKIYLSDVEEKDSYGHANLAMDLSTPKYEFLAKGIKLKGFIDFEVGTWSTSVLKYLGVDHFGRIPKKIYGKQQIF